MIIDDPSWFLFLSFGKDHLAKIYRHLWKVRVKNSKSAKFESDLLKSNELM